MPPRNHEHASLRPSLAWVPCGTCWGQRKLVTLEPHGIVTAETRPSCLGVGERLQDTHRH